MRSSSPVVLVKMAAYGFIRLTLPLFPDALAELAPLMCWAAAAGIVYGALIALAQTDIRRMIAYSTISHAGFVVLGVFALNQHGIQGAVVHIVSLALSTGGLFLAAMMLVQRRNTWDMEAYGGLWLHDPRIFRFSPHILPGLRRPAGPEQFRRGIPHPGRGFSTARGDRGGCRHRGHPGGRLHAPDVQESHLRSFDQGREQGDQGSLVQGDGPSSPA